MREFLVEIVKSKSWKASISNRGLIAWRTFSRYSPLFFVLEGTVVVVLFILLDNLILNLLQEIQPNQRLKSRITSTYIDSQLYLIFPLRRIHIAQLLLQVGKSTTRFVHDEVQLSIFGVIFVKFSLIFATLLHRCNGRIFTKNRNESTLTHCLGTSSLSRYAHLKPALLDPLFFDRLSRKPSSPPFPVVSFELLVVLLVLCVVPFVRLPLRCKRCSMLLLPLLPLFDCPPLMGEAIRLLMGSDVSTVKLSPHPLSSSEFGVELGLR